MYYNTDPGEERRNKVKKHSKESKKQRQQQSCAKLDDNVEEPNKNSTENLPVKKAKTSALVYFLYGTNHHLVI